MQKKAYEAMVAEVKGLRAQLEEAQETLNAIRRGEVDGLVVSTPKGEQVYTLTGAEKPYRALIEDMREGAVMLSDDNTVLYCNSGFAKMMRRPIEKIVGTNIENMVCPTYIPALTKLLSLARSHKSAVTKEVTLQARDDILVPTLMSVNSLKSDTLNNTFLVVTDLSEHMEEEIKRYTHELENAQIALSESEQRWATTLASIGDAVIATDTLGKIKFMNGVAEELTGWTLNEASKRPVQEIFKIINELSRKTVDDPISKVLEKGMIVGLANHTILIRKDKSEVAIDDSGAPIKDKEGKITGVVLIFRDITERRKAEDSLKRSEAHYRSLFVNMEEGFSFNKVVYDKVGRAVDFVVLEANKVFEETTGLKREKVIGKGIAEAYPRAYEGLEFQKIFQIFVNVAETGKSAHFEIYSHSMDKWLVGIVYSPMKGYFAVLNEDVTQRKITEKKLDEYRNNLEKLVEERTKQLKDSERLAAIGATAGMVGHDIRNPLQAIIGDLYLAEEEIKEIPNTESKRAMLETLAEIEKNVDYINKIVADLQDYARAIAPAAQEVDLGSLCEEVLSKYGVPENVKASCRVEPEAKILISDLALLKRILSNLTSNAVQAMPQGGELAIEAYKNAGDVFITVEDTGVGIANEVKEKLFTPMFTTIAKGQGFGLAVVKRMAEALGGSVTYESEVGKGTKFTIRLPPPKS
ncbi:MAG TPA: PAS domain S-box protein [Candidatus Deferrimicrobiaceae bacterium]|nr:PAS domain S-box protein [Candidatus Deferrimicrobiaceae bacterium]